MTVYATSADFAIYGLPATINADPALVTRQLSAASGIVDAHIASRTTPPLATWTDDLRQLVCEIAAYRVLRIIGFDPESPNDITIKQRHDAAIADLKEIKEGRLTPAWTPLSPMFAVSSDPARGWYETAATPALPDDKIS